VSTPPTWISPFGDDDTDQIDDTERTPVHHLPPDEPTTTEPTTTEPTPTEATPDADHSRRTLMRRLVGAAAGAAAAAVVLDRPALAATGAMQYGATNNSGIDTTVLRANVEDGRTLSVINFSPGGYAMAGEAETVYGGHGTEYAINMTSDQTGINLNTVGNGVQASSTDGFGVTAYSQRGIGLFVSGASTMRLDPRNAPPPAQSTIHYNGEIVVDQYGDLWSCVATGTPGQWRKLSGSSTAGAFHAIAPKRVYDSRAAQPAIGILAGGTSRTVSVADARDIATGAVTTAGIVPVGATAITCNVTVVDTVGAGFLTVNPGGSTVVESAAINWSATGQVLNNGIVARLDDQRRLTVTAGGGAGVSTNVVIDVTGFYR
jgi:hypothetical protein